MTSSIFSAVWDTTSRTANGLHQDEQDEENEEEEEEGDEEEKDDNEEEISQGSRPPISISRKERPVTLLLSSMAMKSSDEEAIWSASHRSWTMPPSTTARFADSRLTS